MTLDVYTDGSHLKHGTGRLGCGGVLVKNGKLADKFSKELLPGELLREFGSSDVSNPTAEMIGVLEALRTFEFNPGDQVFFHADYAGVKAWCEGTWKINKPYIQKIKDCIMEEIENKRIKAEFKWVKGHQSIKTSSDAFWNNYVDSLAKGKK